MTRRAPLCPACRHKVSRHGPGGCEAYYSCGPSGTFRCPCKARTRPARAERKRRNFSGITLTCMECGNRGRRDWIRARCPWCGCKATYSNVM